MYISFHLPQANPMVRFYGVIIRYVFLCIIYGVYDYHIMNRILYTKLKIREGYTALYTALRLEKIVN